MHVFTDDRQGNIHDTAVQGGHEGKEPYRRQNPPAVFLNGRIINIICLRHNKLLSISVILGEKRDRSNRPRQWGAFFSASLLYADFLKISGDYTPVAAVSATCIMSLKVWARSSAVVSSPVRMLLEMVRTPNARRLYLAAMR